MDKNKSIMALQEYVTLLSWGAFEHLAQVRVFNSLGYTKFAQRFADHAKEEYEWLDKLMDRILDLGGEICFVPRKAMKTTVTDPLTYLNAEEKRQIDGLALLAQSMCEVKDDITTYDLLKDYYKDEEQDLYTDQKELELIKKIGESEWLLSQL